MAGLALPRLVWAVSAIVSLVHMEDRALMPVKHAHHRSIWYLLLTRLALQLLPDLATHLVKSLSLTTFRCPQKTRLSPARRQPSSHVAHHECLDLPGSVKLDVVNLSSAHPRLLLLAL